MTVGILALQGDVAEHRAALQRHGLEVRPVRRPSDLPGLRGMVLPGGESTTMLRLLGVEGLEAPLAASLRSGIPVLATCAGLILLADEVVHPRQRSFGLLPLTVERNGYGRQYHSGTFALRSVSLPPGTTGTFIRAPRILEARDGVELLAWRDDDPVFVRRGPILGTCFHPELQHDHPVTGMFVELVKSHRPADNVRVAAGSSQSAVSQAD